MMGITNQKKCKCKSEIILKHFHGESFTRHTSPVNNQTTEPLTASILMIAENPQTKDGETKQCNFTESQPVSSFKSTFPSHRCIFTIKHCDNISLTVMFNT